MNSISRKSAVRLLLLFGLFFALTDSRRAFGRMCGDEFPGAPACPLYVMADDPLDPWDGGGGGGAPPSHPRPSRDWWIPTPTPPDPTTEQSPVSVFPWSFGGTGSDGVDMATGTFQKTIHVEVPKFHGIEPSLTLRYASSTFSNSLAGVGWDLAGLSGITAATRGGGQLVGDNAERYFMDGLEIFRCDAGSTSPSCVNALAGSTSYFARTETYQRISRYNNHGYDDVWVVWDKNGTQTEFHPIFTTGQGFTNLYRWAISTVTDTHGNHVDYSWICESGADCYPDQVDYNGVNVKFFRETRPDPVVKAAGAQTTRMNQRLKTIRIQVGGTLLRAYRLAYSPTASPTSGRSLLTDVQVHGKDASIVDGTVAGGAKFPDQSFSYYGKVPTFAETSAPGMPSGKFCSRPTVSAGTDGDFDVYFSEFDKTFHMYERPDSNTTQSLIPIDLNGDGCADLLSFLSTDTSTYVARAWRSKCDGAAGFLAPVDTLLTTSTSHTEPFVGDFNGDGKPDLAFFPTAGYTKMKLFLNNGDGTFTEQAVDRTPVGPSNNGNFYLGATTFTASSGERYYDPFYTGWITPSLVATTRAYKTYESMRYRTADINGDGNDDLIVLNGCSTDGPDCGPHNLTLYFSKGRDATGTFLGFQPATQSNVQLSIHGAKPPKTTNVLSMWFGFTGYGVADLMRYSFGDFNGDGKVDLIGIDRSGIRTFNSMTVWLSNGDGTFRTVQQSGASVFVPDYYEYYGLDESGVAIPHDTRIFSVDYNGDGLSDVLVFPRSRSEVAPVRVFLSRGNGTFDSPFLGPNQNFFQWGSAFQIMVPNLRSVPAFDVNGDGHSDITVYDTATKELTMQMAGGAVARGPAINYPHCMMWGDFDGDGRTDILLPKDTDDFTGTPRLFLTSTEPADLLKTAANGYGGMETVEYRNTRGLMADRPAAMYVTSKVTVNPGPHGSGPTTVTTYRFADGRFASAQDDRRFLGFRTGDRFDPPAAGQTAGIQERNWFIQNPKLGPLTEKMETYGNGGALLIGRTTKTYTLQTDRVPYNVQLTDNLSETFDPSGALVTALRKSTLFDGFGNITQSLDLGEDAVFGDELLTKTDYAVNSLRYIVAFPAAIRTYTGTVADDAHKIAERLFYSDGQSDNAAQPIRGDVTTNAAWKGIPAAGAGTTNAAASTSLFSRALTFLAQTFQIPVDGPASGGASSDYVYVRSEYDNAGNLFRSYDGAGFATTRTYDTTGTFVIQTRNPAGQTTGTDWDMVCGLPTVVTDANLTTITNSYDNLCRLKGVRLPPGVDRTLNYCDDIGLPACGSVDQYSEDIVPGPNGSFVFTQTYKTLRQGNRTGHERISENRFDGAGNPYTASSTYYADEPQSAKWTTSLYDDAGRISTSTNPDLSQVVKSYTGRTVTSFDETNHGTRETFDAFGRKILMENYIDGAWQITGRFAYDSVGRLNSTTDAKGMTERYDFDALGRKIANHSPQSGNRTFAYDDRGLLVLEQDAKNQSTRYEYDSLGRTVRRTEQAFTTTAQVYLFVYDEPRSGYANIGRQTSIIGPAGANVYSEVFNYDPMGRIVTRLRIVDGKAYPFQFTFDSSGRLLWMRYPDGDTLGTPTSPIMYDEAGRIVSIPGVVTAADYEANNRLRSVTYANGNLTGYSFDPNRGWLTGIRASATSAGGSPILENLTFPVVGTDGYIQQIRTSTGSGWNYQYDDVHQMTRAQGLGTGGISDPSYDQTLRYDLNGNITCNSRFGQDCSASGAQNYAYRTARTHAVSDINGGTMSFEYDANGNRTKKFSSGMAIQTIDFDGRDRPSLINGIAFTYDSAGERLKKVSSGVTTVYPGNGMETSACTPTKYIPFAGSLVAKKETNEMTWLFTDHLGSIFLATDRSGNVVKRSTYRPFGEEISPTPGSAGAPGFVSQRTDETGLIYLHARYYDPTTATFVSPDPILSTYHPAGFNAYEYALNDPVNHKDPSGRCAQWGNSIPGGGIEVSTWKDCYSYDQVRDAVNGMYQRGVGLDNMGVPVSATWQRDALMRLAGYRQFCDSRGCSWVKESQILNGQSLASGVDRLSKRLAVVQREYTAALNRSRSQNMSPLRLVSLGAKAQGDAYILNGKASVDVDLISRTDPLTGNSQTDYTVLGTGEAGVSTGFKGIEGVSNSASVDLGGHHETSKGANVGLFSASVYPGVGGGLSVGFNAATKTFQITPELGYGAKAGASLPMGMEFSKGWDVAATATFEFEPDAFVRLFGLNVNQWVDERIRK